MADAQDLKSWGRKKPCGFESHHRHQFKEESQIENCKLKICHRLARVAVQLLAGFVFGCSVQGATVRTLDGNSYEGEVFLEPSNIVSVVLNDSRKKAIPLSNVLRATFTSSQTSLGHFGQIAEGWTNIDVGDVTIPGTAGQSNRLFAIRVGGGDIGEQIDSFHFIYFLAQPEADVLARIVSIDAGDRAARAGVMLRDSLKPDAKFAFAAVNAAGQISVQQRSGTGWKGGPKAPSATVTLPCWFKISRLEKTFRASVSTNGAHWQQIALDSLDLKQSCYAGLAVASHGSLSVCTALIDGVSRTARGVRGEYFAEANFQELKTNRIDPTIKFIWSGNRPPVEGLPANNFSVRWTGELEPQYSEPYIFHYDAHDAQLWVNDQPLPHIPLQREARDSKGPTPIPLLLKAGNRYPFKLELRQTAGPGVMRLGWSSSSQGIEILPTRRLLCSLEARGQPGARPAVSNAWVMGRGIMLRDGSFVTGSIRGITETGVKFTYRDDKEHIVPVHQVARAVFRISPRNSMLGNVDLPAGALLDNGDFIEGSVRLGTGRNVKVSSVLLGLRSYNLDNSGVAALVFGNPIPGSAAYEVRLSDNSVFMAKSISVAQSEVEIVESFLGPFRVPREAVTEIRAGQRSIRNEANRSGRDSRP